MLHNLLFVPDYNRLMGHPQAGNSWEGFVIQQIMAVLPKNRQGWFYRTQDGAETDLLITQGNSITHAIEIKLTNAPQVTRGYTESFIDLKPDKAIIVTPGADAFRIKDWQILKLFECLRIIAEDFK